MISFQGVFNVPVILKPGGHRQFLGIQLNGIASTLEAGLRLRNSLQKDESPNLHTLAQNLSRIDESIPTAIRHAIRVWN